MQEIIVNTDWILLPVYLFVFLIIGAWYRGRIEDERDKKNFTLGLWIKLAGGFAFAMIYTYHYGGGDTFSYWKGAKCIINLAGEDFNSFWHIMTGSMDAEHLSVFNSDTGYPPHRDDPNSFAVNVFLVPFVWLGAKKFLLSTLVMNFFLFFPIFRFYRFLRNLNKDRYQIPAIAAFFIPSVVFWSSGMLKDAFTFSFSLIVVVSLFNLLIRRKQILRYLIYFIISAYIIISLKPYILYALMAAALIWLGVEQLRNIKSYALKIILMPLLILIVLGGGIWAFSSMGSIAGGAYSNVDAMVERAYITQQDLSSDYYGENTFDIGEFEPTVGGLLSKFPQAVVAGLYRPYPWDGSEIFMLLSGTENFVLMILTLFIILRVGPFTFTRYLGQKPFLTFCIAFSVILAFFVGVTTGVFGALVRYRIPFMPFFLFMLLYVYQEKRRQKALRDK